MGETGERIGDFGVDVGTELVFVHIWFGGGYILDSGR